MPERRLLLPAPCDDKWKVFDNYTDPYLPALATIRVIFLHENQQKIDIHDTRSSIIITSELQKLFKEIVCCWLLLSIKKTQRFFNASALERIVERIGS